MKNKFTYFNIPYFGISPVMKAAVKAREDEGYEGVVLTTTLCTFPRSVSHHFHEPRYAQQLRSLRSKFRVNHVAIVHVDEHVNSVGSAPEKTAEPENLKALTGLHARIEIVSDIENLDLRRIISYPAVNRERKAKDAVIVIEFKGNKKASQAELTALADATQEAGNPLWVYGATVNDLPAACEERFTIKTGTPPESFNDIRGVVSYNPFSVLNSIAHGIPVYDTGLIKDAEGFVVADIAEVLTASVASTKKREKFLRELEAEVQGTAE